MSYFVYLVIRSVICTRVMSSREMVSKRIETWPPWPIPCFSLKTWVMKSTHLYLSLLPQISHYRSLWGCLDPRDPFNDQSLLLWIWGKTSCCYLARSDICPDNKGPTSPQRAAGTQIQWEERIATDCMPTMSPRNAQTHLFPGWFQVNCRQIDLKQ
jgi:hypothetical protein